MSSSKSVCGLDCGTCPAHQAHQNNDAELAAKTAAEWTKDFGTEIPPEKCYCVGCREEGDPHGGYCDECPVRACATDKKVANCAACGEYADCQTRKDFEAETGINIAEKFAN